MVRQDEEVHKQQSLKRGKMETAVNYVSSTKTNANYQSTPVPRMQPKVQHQQFTSITRNSPQSHSCKWSMPSKSYGHEQRVVNKL